MEARIALPDPGGVTVRATTFAVAVLLSAVPAAAGVYHVAKANPACSSSGPGTHARPYCSIRKAVEARPEPGNTFVVHPGVYREQISAIPSGAPGAPIVFHAAGPGVFVDGADDFGSPALWEPAGAGVWLARSVTWVPRQVFAGDQRLAPTTALPEAMTRDTWRAEPDVGLYVHLGGDAPSTRGVLVGRRSHAFRVLGRSHVVIEGFEVLRSEDRGIYVLGGASDVVVRANRVRLTGSHGIAITRSSACIVASNRVERAADHGIAAVEASGCRFEGNVCAHNARPEARAANGLNFYASTGNWVGRNVWHHNQDSGQQIGGGSHDNVFVHNVAWRNGDHGYDHLGSSRNVVLGCVAWGNHRDGFSFEGLSPANTLINSIAVDNGITTGRYDLWVETGSDSAFVSEANVFWNSTAQPPVRWGPAIFARVADYTAATGRDTRTVQDDPRFVSAATGDFRLAPGSPAIDAADATHAEWPEADFTGEPRRDDPATPDRGAGTVAYGDRGAFESSGDAAPRITVATAVTVEEGAPTWIEVVAEDPDGEGIATLEADLGALPPGAAARFTMSAGGGSGVLEWTPAWTDGRDLPYLVTFRARNALEGRATVAIGVRNVDRAPTVTAPDRVRVAPGALATFGVEAIDPDGGPFHLDADLSRLPDGHGATFVREAADRGTFRWPVGPELAGLRFVARFTAWNALATTREVVIEIDGAPDDGRDRGEVAVAAPEGVPRVLALSLATPLPARERAELRLDLPEASAVRWSVHDAQGRVCWRESRAEAAGRVTLAWPGAGRASPGVYFARVEAAGRAWTRRIVVAH